jgi:hypothetical protein
MELSASGKGGATAAARQPASLQRCPVQSVGQLLVGREVPPWTGQQQWQGSTVHAAGQ